LKLLDIGYLDNFKNLIKYIKTKFKNDSEKQEMYIDILNNTCIDSNSNSNNITCNRISTEWFDPDLVKLLCTDLNLDIDGWIYFVGTSNSNFHGEVLLCEPKNNLQYRSVYSVPDTVYPNTIPTFDEFKRSRPKFTEKLAENGVAFVKHFSREIVYK
jgi:hypothetical protein